MRHERLEALILSGLKASARELSVPVLHDRGATAESSLEPVQRVQQNGRELVSSPTGFRRHRSLLLLRRRTHSLGKVRREREQRFPPETDVIKQTAPAHCDVESVVKKWESHTLSFFSPAVFSVIEKVGADQRLTRYSKGICFHNKVNYDLEPKVLFPSLS